MVALVLNLTLRENTDNSNEMPWRKHFEQMVGDL